MLFLFLLGVLLLRRVVGIIAMFFLVIMLFITLVRILVVLLFTLVRSSVILFTTFMGIFELFLVVTLVRMVLLLAFF